jgi:hypothetical protein
MPARTYSSDVCLTCPCPDCEGREVRITLRKFRSLSRLPSPHASKSCTSSCRDATTGNSKAKPGSPNRSANTQPAHRLLMISADSAGPRWAVSTGVGRRRPMTFRWSQRIGIVRSLRSWQRPSAEGLHRVRGGHVRGIQQLASPSNRTCPESGDSLRL